MYEFFLETIKYKIYCAFVGYVLQKVRKIVIIHLRHVPQKNMLSVFHGFVLQPKDLSSVALCHQKQLLYVFISVKLQRKEGPTMRLLDGQLQVQHVGSFH
jgi:hypothetical protein